MKLVRSDTGRWRLSVVMLSALALMCAWAAARAQEAAPTPSPPPVNERSISPHWTPGGCGQCHAVEDGKLAKIAPAAVDTICLRCHNGRDAAAEAHPSGRPANTAHAQTPTDWPTPDDRLSCLTCHEVLSACDRNRTRPAYNPTFLRGPIGSGTTQYCAICHQADASHQRLNPHRMLTPDGAIERSTCQRCHTPEISDDRNAVRTGNANLLRRELDICLGCHAEHVDFFTPGHIGAQPSASMREYIAARPSPLPLSPNGVITCSTCHNPHQAGLFPESSPLGRGGIEVGPGRERLNLRGEGPSICGDCHGK